MSFEELLKSEIEAQARTNGHRDYIIFRKTQNRIQAGDKRPERVERPLTVFVDHAGTTPDLIQKYQNKGWTLEHVAFRESESKDDRVNDVKAKVYTQKRAEDAIRAQLSAKESGVKKKYEEALKQEAIKDEHIESGKKPKRASGKRAAS